MAFDFNPPQFASPSYDPEKQRRFVDDCVRAFEAVQAAMNPGGTDVSLLGWTTTVTFSVVDEDTVDWTSGNLITSSGNTYPLNAGSTGNMTARTYIYFDLTIPTDLQITTTASDALGAGKVHIATADPRTDRSFFQVFGGGGGISLPGSDLYIGFVGLINGDFELGVKTGWASAVESDGSLVNLGSGAHRGSWVMEVSAGGNQFSEAIPIGPGERVLGQAWAKLSTIDPADNAQQLAVRFYDDANSEISRSVLATANIGDTEWQHLRGTATAPSLAAYYVVDLGQAAGTGDWWWDDVGTVIAPRDSDIVLGNASGTLDLDTQVSGTLSTAFAEAGLINSNVTINADGSLSGAGAGQASLTSLPGQVQAGSIAANAVTATEIAALTITAAQIAATTITGAKIAASTITTTNIASNTITAADIAALTITAAEIAASTITGSKIAANTITASNIAANTITAAEIAAGTITATQIASGTITTTQIAAGTIVAGDLASTIAFVSQSLTLGSGATFSSGQTAYDTGTGWWFEYNGGTPRVSVGNSSGNNWTWNGSILAITGRVTVTNPESSFTPTYVSAQWSGGTDPGSTTIRYVDYGIYVVMYISDNVNRFATSGGADADEFSFSGVPSAIRPSASSVRVVCTVLNGGLPALAEAEITTSGEVIFSIMDDSTTNFDLDNIHFTTSGSKGFPLGWMLWYPIV